MMKGLECFVFTTASGYGIPWRHAVYHGDQSRARVGARISGQVLYIRVNCYLGGCKHFPKVTSSTPKMPS